jgi:predicted DNA-binding protein
MPRGDPTDAINIRLSRELLARIRARAQRERRTLAELIRILIERGLERGGRGKAG